MALLAEGLALDNSGSRSTDASLFIVVALAMDICADCMHTNGCPAPGCCVYKSENKQPLM